MLYNINISPRIFSRKKFLKTFNHKGPNPIDLPEGRPLVVINRILELLEDGEWLDLKEIAQKSRLTEPKAEMILNFLNKFHFIELDEKQKRAKATPPMLQFLKTTRHIET